MALGQFRWLSSVLKKRVEAQVIYPSSGLPPFPTLYLLHGLTDDSTAWCRFSRIESYVAELPLIVVMPDGFRGFYTSNEEGPDYATYTAFELPQVIERTFRARDDRAGRCIGGLSMGGYGALRLSLGFPDRFVSAACQSGAVTFGTVLPSIARVAEGQRIFGSSPAGTDHDLLHLAARCRDSGQLPRIWIDCGTGDHLIGENREFHRQLQEMGVEHEYVEYDGAHNWDYWDRHVRDAIAFHCRALGIPFNWPAK